MHQPLLLLPLLLLPLLLLPAHTVWGKSSSSGHRRTALGGDTQVEWPGTGMALCQQLQEPHYRRDCLQCFTTAGHTLTKIKECVRTRLPKVLAECGTHTHGNSISTFNFCIARRMEHLDNINKRAELLYTKGSAVLKKVIDSVILEDGPGAVFSSIAQELLINTDSLKKALNAEDNDCFTRFQVDSANENWHLHPSERLKGRTNSHPKIQAFQKTRTTDNQEGAGNLVYEYGVMGHQMPFRGIGPLAVDILKGICLMQYLEETRKLQVFVDTSLSSISPMPAWLFQENLKKISSITLP